MRKYHLYDFLDAMIFIALIGMGIVMLNSCASVGNGLKVVQAGDLSKVARADLYVKVDEQSAYGILVAKRKNPQSYSITIQSAHKMDVLFVESCHRHEVYYDKGNKFSFAYSPNAALESAGICPLKFSTLEKDGRRKQYATIVFQNPAYQLGGDMRCNGEKRTPVSVSLCQSKAGKVQEIHFPEKVRMFSDSSSPECPLPKAIEGQDFEFEMPKGSCTYGFSTFSAPHKRLLLVTIGYDSDEYPEAL